MMPVPGLDNYAQPLDQLKSFHGWLAETVEARRPSGRLRVHEPVRRPRAARADGGRTVREGPFVGLIVNTSVQGRYLDSEEADDFFEMVSELGVPVFLHPGAEPVGTDSVRDFRLVEQVSRFFDVAVSLAALVVAGPPGAVPGPGADRRHGGGIALIHNRLDAAQRGRPPAEGVIARRAQAQPERVPAQRLRGHREP